MYGTCYSYDWIEQPFPDYLEFPGDDASMDAGTHGSWAGPTVIQDAELVGTECAGYCDDVCDGQCYTEVDGVCEGQCIGSCN